MKTNPLDLQLRVRMKELRQHALHLHSRRMAIELDAARRSAGDVGDDLGLEIGMRGGGVQIGQQVGHQQRGPRVEGSPEIWLHLFKNPRVGLLPGRVPP